jgi:undecaprenyl-diphosphatase
LDLFLKYAFHRTRPTSEAVKVLQELTTPSFPSGHVVHYVVFFGFLLATMFYVPRIPKEVRIVIGAFCGFLILAVGFSRIYLGAHWATDVIGGYLVGIFTA